METVQKFTGRAEGYEKYRPAYPSAVYDFILDHLGFPEHAVIADIGAGTGIFAMPLLERGFQVYCVEPNADMKAILNSKASAFPYCTALNATAEDTGLPDCSVDLVTVAQAFHWFDRKAFQKECKRILTPNGKIALLWNVRDEGGALTRELAEISKRYCPHFKGFSGGIKIGCEQFNDFFKTTCQLKTFANDIVHDDVQSFIGRCLSSSYALKEEEENYEEYIKALQDLFYRYAAGERIVIKNHTELYWGEV